MLFSLDELVGLSLNQGDGGGGSDEGNVGLGNPNPSGTLDVPNGASPQVWQSFQNLLNRHDGAQQAAFTLFQENYQQRQELRENRDRISRLEQNQIPEGSVVVPAEVAGELEDFDPQSLPKVLKEHAEFGERLAEAERKERFREISEIMGYKPTVLRDRDQAEGGLEYEIRTEESDGGSVKRVFVKKDGESKELSSYAKENWGDYLPALEASGNGSAGRSRQEGRGVRFVRQQAPPEQGEGDGDLVGEYISYYDQAGKRTNPLSRKKEQRDAE